jgi:transposase-like protein
MATMNGSSRPATDVTGVFDSVLSDLPGRREAPRPDPEVVARAKRRRFTGEYKQRILAQTDASKGSGEIGAVLRCEGLYSSHLTKWRRERADGILDGLAPQKRGPKSKTSPLASENQKLRRDDAPGCDLRANTGGGSQARPDQRQLDGTGATAGRS